MLKLKHEADLASCGLALDPNDKTKAVTLAQALAPLKANGQAAPLAQAKYLSDDFPDLGKIRDRIPLVRETLKAFRDATKARKDSERYESGAAWDCGDVLLPIRDYLKNLGWGSWGQFLMECGETKRKRQPDGSWKIVPQYNRAEEALVIREQFPSRAEAAKVNLRIAFKRRRKEDWVYGHYEDCFAIPDNLWQVVKAQYNPSLDAFATDEWHLCDNYFCPARDAFLQDWTAHCPNKVAFVNGPFNFSVLGKVVVKAYEESQRGLTCVCMLPWYKSDDWFSEIVVKYGEVRHILGKVICKGFGPKKGRCCGNVGKNPYETIICIFRPNQLGFTGEYIRRPGVVPTATNSGVENIKPPKIVVPRVCPQCGQSVAAAKKPKPR